jgi:hypothetical protein
MLQVTLLMVGKTRQPFIQAGLAFYQKRLKLYLELTLKSVREEKEAGNLSAEGIMAREGERLLAAVPPRSWVAALDPGGAGIHLRGICRLAGSPGGGGPSPHLPHRRPPGPGPRDPGRGPGAPGAVATNPDP